MKKDWEIIAVEEGYSRYEPNWLAKLFGFVSENFKVKIYVIYNKKKGEIFVRKFWIEDGK